MTLLPRGLVMLWWLHAAASWKRFVAGCKTRWGMFGCAMTLTVIGFLLWAASHVNSLPMEPFNPVIPLFQVVLVIVFLCGLLLTRRESHVYPTSSEFNALLTGPYTYRQAVAAYLLDKAILLARLAVPLVLLFAACGLAGLGPGLLLGVLFVYNLSLVLGQADQTLSTSRAAARCLPLRFISLAWLARLSVFALAICLLWRASQLTQDDVNKYLIESPSKGYAVGSLPEIRVFTAPLYPYLQLIRTRGITADLFVWSLVGLGINVTLLVLQVVFANPKHEFLRAYAATNSGPQHSSIIQPKQARKAARIALPLLPFLGNAAAITWQMGTCMLRGRLYAFAVGPIFGVGFAFLIGPATGSSPPPLEAAATLGSVSLWLTLLVSLLFTVTDHSTWRAWPILTMPFTPTQIAVARTIPRAFATTWTFLGFTLASAMVLASPVLLAFSLLFALPLGLILSGLANFMVIRFPEMFRPHSPGQPDNPILALRAMFTMSLLLILGFGLSAAAGFGAWQLTFSPLFALLAAAIVLLLAALLLIPLSARAFAQLPKRLEGQR